MQGTVAFRVIIILLFLGAGILPGRSQGTWIALNNLAPDTNEGVMLLLPDGTVMVKTQAGDTADNGNIWDKLAPDIHGSYLNGTWSRLAPMHDTRYYFSSQLLKDGRVYVAGGEYGTGKKRAEIYSPLSDTWDTLNTPGVNIGDACSEIMDDGSVLQAFVKYPSELTKVFDPASNTYGPDINTDVSFDESSWLKLPDNSILFVGEGTTQSERYIPALGQWIQDAEVPLRLYDTVAFETGAALLLPDGRGFFLGATGHSAYYMPSGDTSPGRWAAGPDIPNHLSTPDAPAAMMVNGKILCAFSPIPTDSNEYASPVWFYEFDYTTNTFTEVGAPGGGDTLSDPSFIFTFLDLPDGTVMCAIQGLPQYFIYVPAGLPLEEGKPTVGNFISTGCDSFMLTGTGFNGISEGAAYGDDWQMETNYPLVRFSSGDNVYYARTVNWNHRGVQTGNLADTVYFSIPDSMPTGLYSMQVAVNGFGSDPVLLSRTPCQLNSYSLPNSGVEVYPVPAGDLLNVAFSVAADGNYTLDLYNIAGQLVMNQSGFVLAGDNIQSLNTGGLAAGVYILSVHVGQEVRNVKCVVKEGN